MTKSKYISNEEAKKRFNQFKKDQLQSSLAHLYQPYMKMVLSVGLKYFQDMNLAEDLVMDVYELLYRKAKNHEVNHVSSWIYSIAKNECLMQLRKKKRTFSSEELYFYDSAVENEGLLHLFNDREESKMLALHECLAVLKPEQKQCIVSFYLEKKTYKQIASEANIELKKVKSFIQNGKRNLKQCIESKI